MKRALQIFMVLSIAPYDINGMTKNNTYHPQTCPSIHPLVIQYVHQKKPEFHTQYKIYKNNNQQIVKERYTQLPTKKTDNIIITSSIKDDHCYHENYEEFDDEYKKKLKPWFYGWKW